MDAAELADVLLSCGAVTFSEDGYTFASGMRSPVYCDCRRLLSQVSARGKVADAFAELIRAKFDAADMIAGVATAGIAHAALAADRLGWEMVYVRGERKSHGQKNLIEGGSVEGRRVVMIEDSLTTGGSVLRAVQAVRDAGGQVECVLAVYGYAFDDTAQAFSEAGVPLATLTNYPTVVEVAQQKGLVKSEDVERLRAWRTNPWEYQP